MSNFKVKVCYSAGTLMYWCSSGWIRNHILMSLFLDLNFRSYLTLVLIIVTFSKHVGVNMCKIVRTILNSILYSCRICSYLKHRYRDCRRPADIVYWGDAGTYICRTVELFLNIMHPMRHNRLLLGFETFITVNYFGIHSVKYATVRNVFQSTFIWAIH